MAHFGLKCALKTTASGAPEERAAGLWIYPHILLNGYLLAGDLAAAHEKRQRSEADI